MNNLSKLKKNYEVKDLLQTTTKLIFVLESPHKKELEFSVPVAGPSGKTMTKKLIPGEDLPFGRLLGEYIQAKEGSSELSKFGIMNICPIPMQKSAYQTEDVEKNEEYLTNVEKIRTSQTKKGFKDLKVQEVHDEILKDFVERLNAIDYKDKIFVPCGNFARSMFVAAVNDLEGIQYLDSIPHPSYNSWGQEKYKEVIQELLKTIQSL